MNAALSLAVLNRLSFGPRPGDAEALQQEGLARWLDRQLAPDDGQDEPAAQALDACRLSIKYDGGQDWSAVDEERPLAALAQPVEALWPLADGKRSLPGPERQFPRQQTVAATLVRAVHSRWQLREVLADFWHNHFNVFAGEQTVAVALPSYDRDVIRRHALGNFREFLEAVATSTAMLVYLNNRSSRAGSANENYARELFELHSLGRDAYLNALYDKWRAVPGAAQGAPRGYIDQDVYEAARAFTGWTIEDGAGLGGGQRLPETGRFTFVEGWHDGYQKRVLAQEFDPFQAPMADGRRVLDLVADHPATALHLCRKLCVRLVADRPPERLVAMAAAVWHDNRRKPDQIARVVRAIALSPDFAAPGSGKIKRPLELAASFLRAGVVGFTATSAMIRDLDGSGQRLFGAPAPTGHPDEGEHWLGSSALRRRWDLVLALAENRWKTGALDLAGLFPEPLPAAAAVERWQQRLTGLEADPATTRAILDGMGLKPDRPLVPGKDGDAPLKRIAAYVAMAPRFQTR